MLFDEHARPSCYLDYQRRVYLRVVMNWWFYLPLPEENSSCKLHLFHLPGYWLSTRFIGCFNSIWFNQEGVWPAHYFNCTSTAVETTEKGFGPRIISTAHQLRLKQLKRGLARALFQLHINRGWNNWKGVWPAHYFNCTSTAVDVQLNQPSNNYSWNSRYFSFVSTRI